MTEWPAGCDTPGNRKFICGASDQFWEMLRLVIISASTPAARLFRQEEASFSGTELVITKNEGVLPASDDQISVFWTQGPIPQEDWSSDRTETPNKIIFSPAIDDQLIVVLFFATPEA